MFENIPYFNTAILSFSFDIENNNKKDCILVTVTQIRISYEGIENAYKCERTFNLFQLTKTSSDLTEIPLTRRDLNDVVTLPTPIQRFHEHPSLSMLCAVTTTRTTVRPVVPDLCHHAIDHFKKIKITQHLKIVLKKYLYLKIFHLSTKQKNVFKFLSHNDEVSTRSKTKWQ